MSNAEHIRQLLRPLGVYDLTAPVNGSVLEAEGSGLDRAEAWLGELERECSLIAAESWGLENWGGLLPIVPAAREPEQLRKSVQALLRIGMAPCTQRVLNDTLEGCGLKALVEEVGTGAVQVSFPDCPGIPEQVEELKKNIEAILPVHLGITYLFRYLTWAELESWGWTFETLETMTWDEVEKFVYVQ